MEVELIEFLEHLKGRFFKTQSLGNTLRGFAVPHHIAHQHVIKNYRAAMKILSQQLGLLTGVQGYCADVQGIAAADMLRKVAQCVRLFYFARRLKLKQGRAQENL